MDSLSNVFKTITVTAVSAGVDLKPLLAELYDQDRVLFLFYPGRTGDVELRHVANDATRRHLIPQDAGGNEPYPDGPWVWGSMPCILYAASNTDVTIEVVRITK